MRYTGAEHDAAKTQKFEQFAVGWKSVPAFVDLAHLNRSEVQVCFQQKFANPGPRTKGFAPEGSRESLVFLGRGQSNTSLVCHGHDSAGLRSEAPLPHI